MAKATGANTKVYYSAESVIGTTNASPAFKELPYSTSSLQLTADTIEDDRLGGRHVKCQRQGNNNVSGDVASLLAYTDFDDLLEAGLCGSWVSDSPIAGTDELNTGSVRRGFTFLHEYSDMTSTGYEYFTGCEINTINIELAPGDNTGITFGVIGVSSPTTYTEIAGSTYVDPSDQCPFATFDAEVKIDSASVAIATALSVTIDNGIEAVPVIGSKFTGAKSIGKIRATGSATLFFEDFTLYSKFRSETAVNLEFSLTAEDGSVLAFTLPNTIFTNADKPISGEGDILLTLEFSALYDDTSESEIVVTRTPA